MEVSNPQFSNLFFFCCWRTFGLVDSGKEGQLTTDYHSEAKPQIQLRFGGEGRRTHEATYVPPLGILLHNSTF